MAFSQRTLSRRGPFTVGLAAGCEPLIAPSVMLSSNIETAGDSLPLKRARSIPGSRFGFVLALPAQLLLLLVVVVPTLIVVWLSLTDWQPTDRMPWYKAELSGFGNFIDLFSDRAHPGRISKSSYNRRHQQRPRNLE